MTYNWINSLMYEYGQKFMVTKSKRAVREPFG